MKEMSKKKKIALYVIVGTLVLGFLSSMSEEQTETSQTTTTTTEQTAEPKATTEPEKKTAKKTKADLDACCVTIAETLNSTYKPKGFEVLGFANSAEKAVYAVYMPYTTEEVKTLYAHDKQALRELWGNIARTTWNYLTEQGFEVPADVEVDVQIYAADNKECVVYLTKHDTKLKV